MVAPLAGELEGAAARLEWARIPLGPCDTGTEVSEAGTFPPPQGRERIGMLGAEPWLCPSYGLEWDAVS